MSSRESIVAGIIAALRNGPATRDQLRASIHDAEVDSHPELLGSALQWAKAEGLIEYSKVGEDRRSYWRLVERPPVRKVGIEEARELIAGPLHYHVKSKVEVAHEQGFDDGQQHAFQIVADRIRKIIAENVKIGCSPSIDELGEMADEVEAGAWASDEP